VTDLANNFAIFIVGIGIYGGESANSVGCGPSTAGFPGGNGNSLSTLKNGEHLSTGKSLQIKFYHRCPKINQKSTPFSEPFGQENHT
jgi:hypothetical protein